MSEPLLNVMKIMLLAGLYLFFVRVLWAVYNELRDPRMPVQPSPPVRPELRATTRRPAPGATSRSVAAGPNAASRPAPVGLLVGQLVVVEPNDLAGRSWALGNEVTVGRDPSCGVQLDDTYVSTIHARIFNSKGTFMVEDLDSRNGTLLDGYELEASRATKLDPGARIQIGTTVLEFS